jgi:hypothetical protein
MAINTDINQAFEDFLRAPRGDKLIRIHISRNTLIAIIVSLLIHAIVLLFVLPKIEDKKAPESQTIEVSLAPRQEAAKAVEPTPIPQLPAEKLPETKSKPIPKTKPPKVMTQKPSKNTKPSFSVPDTPNVIETPEKSPEKIPPKDNIAPTDMMAYVNQKRAQRQAQESDAARINAEAAAKEAGPSESEKRDQRIKNNFESGGNGIFEITSLGAKNATFSFRGWLNDYSSSRRLFFDIEASAGQDVRLVMIRRMIGLIREHYQGDFNWESHRMARVVSLSARVEDSAFLEDFMMKEFFGANYK